MSQHLVLFTINCDSLASLCTFSLQFLLHSTFTLISFPSATSILLSVGLFHGSPSSSEGSFAQHSQDSTRPSSNATSSFSCLLLRVDVEDSPLVGVLISEKYKYTAMIRPLRGGAVGLSVSGRRWSLDCWHTAACSRVSDGREYMSTWIAVYSFAHVHVKTTSLDDIVDSHLSAHCFRIDQIRNSYQAFLLMLPFLPL